MGDTASPLAGCHYIGKDKGDLGKLPVEDNKSTACMISGCSAAFGKGNGPTKVILSHSTTTPSINITRLYLLPALLPFGRLALVCFCAEVVAANFEIASRRTPPGSNSLLFTISFFSCLHVPCTFAVKYQTTIVLLLRNVGSHPKEERNCWRKQFLLRSHMSICTLSSFVRIHVTFFVCAD